MLLVRVLENEVMDSLEEATTYDEMDHSTVNTRFVDDLLAAGLPGNDVLDLGTGTARIPMELCRRHADCRVMAVDAAGAMLDQAYYNISAAELTGRIQLAQADGRKLPYADGLFHAVICNTIVHHIADPLPVLAEAVRVTAPGGLLMIRDLTRPDTEEQLATLVEQYAGQEAPYAKQMFGDSLRAAFTLAEIRDMVASLGFPPDTVTMTSDRHWTWLARKGSEARD